ncbi:phosphoribosylformylglycinamidine synthase [Candidatus Daviesbacteria bacterium]|nr:phosphoribosylformylglycinamidine synthase [Candidatus Daviesbacteria bacterium]
MVARIEVYSKVEDTRAKVLLKNLSKLVKKVWVVDVYTIVNKLNIKQLKLIANALTNPVSQTVNILVDKKSEQSFSLNKTSFKEKFKFAIEVGFLPGVTDNVSNTVKEIAEDLLKVKFKNEENVYTSQITFVDGTIDQDDAKEIGQNLANTLIQRIHIKNFENYKNDKGMGFTVPKVTLDKNIEVLEVDLEIPDEELLRIGEDGILGKDEKRHGPLALDLDYLKAIQGYFRKIKRKPTDVELETLAQTWSEHCKHTIFADPIDDIQEGIFKTYIKRATEKIRQKNAKKDICVSVFSDNSGAIEFNKDFLITHKVETHNTPSALDPFGGAVTGIVGVNRDTIGFGLGAKPIANTFGFCFASPFKETHLYRDEAMTQKMLSPKRILEGVVSGVNFGGNCSGIPTPQGFLFFDDRYGGKPLVFVGTVGLIPKKSGQKKAFKKKAENGDFIVMVGGKVGIDGIHGATFSSEALTKGSPVSAVQIGDPITQKKFSDAIVKEARDLNLFNSITDNGAGGLSSSVGEMAKQSNGCKVYLDKVPLKYPGLDPWQIWISESQERMTLAVPKKNWKIFSKLMLKRGVEATIIGEFISSGKCQVFYKNKLIVDLSLNFLHNGLPKKHLKTKLSKKEIPEIKFSQPKNLIDIFLKMLGRLNIAGFEFISSQYDHEVQANSLIKPLQGRGRVNGDATIIKPLLNLSEGVVLSQGIYPSYSDIDTYNMAAAAIDTAIRNAITVGVNPEKLALLDNFCWCSSNEAERLGQLKLAAKACYDFAISFKTPFISGKDSMFNDFKGFDKDGLPIKISIPPTLLISSIGIIDDVKKAISLDFKFPGDLIYLLGETFDELGGSEYLSFINHKGGSVPKVDANKNKKLYLKLYQAIEYGLIVSGQSIGRGGLIIALAKKAMGGMLGAEIYLNNLPGKQTRMDYILFSESQGRILVTINPKNKKKFENLMRSVSFKKIGKVRGDSLLIVKNNASSIETTTDEMLKMYKGTFKGF